MNRFTPSQLEAMDEAEKQRQRDDYRRRYNAAARWWLKIMVGLPVFIVSSWHLFDRLALGNVPPDVPWPPPPPGMSPHQKEEEQESS
ncbi:Transcription elongation factor SPT5 [Ophiocordyceps camponoti-floridani]|uniref:Transcription elongation factor SPT5 n=1 Tax=Ophiocordyceps camponoti-floridani TaxID=2030778 RepID=A0A8H4QBE7_9HYPO|nr:Transcription elongation factor SPT5 [Ophiocordyceps camponoti-floridani]